MIVRACKRKFVILLAFSSQLPLAAALSTASSPKPPSLSSQYAQSFLAWYDDTRNSQLDLTHRVYVDPLADLGDGVATFDEDGSVSGERQTSTASGTSLLPSRLVRYASLAYPHHLPTKNRAAKALKSGRLQLNGEERVEGCRRLRQGDVLTLQTDVPKPPSEEVLTKRLNLVNHLKTAGLMVQYEDDHIAGVIKPAGVHTKADTNFRYLSFEDALPAILSPPCSDEARMEALPLPLAVHRLDVRVCGLVLVAKTKRAMVDLGKQFQSREVKKRYEALVVGDPAALSSYTDFATQEGGNLIIDAPIEIEGKGMMPARTAVTILSSLPHAHWGTLSHLELRPETGRTHQLRVHCASVGCPIVGDDLYWNLGEEARSRLRNGSAAVENLPPVRKGGGLYLQSKGATFKHPATHEVMNIDVKVADKFGRLLDKARVALQYNKHM